MVAINYKIVLFVWLLSNVYITLQLELDTNPATNTNRLQFEMLLFI